MLQNSSSHVIGPCGFSPALSPPRFNPLIVQTATKKFMETVEDFILSPTTSPVVRERLIDVLAGAAFTFHVEGFQSTWKRVRPPNKPEDGIPFDMDDPMFDSTRGDRSRTLTSPQVTYVNTPDSPQVQVHPPNTRPQYSDQSRYQILPSGLISLEEDMRRLFEEREVAVYNTRILHEALMYTSPESFRRNPVIEV